MFISASVESADCKFYEVNFMAQGYLSDIVFKCSCCFVMFREWMFDASHGRFIPLSVELFISYCALFYLVFSSTFNSLIGLTVSYAILMIYSLGIVVRWWMPLSSGVRWRFLRPNDVVFVETHIGLRVVEVIDVSVSEALVKDLEDNDVIVPLCHVYFKKSRRVPAVK
jgi:hypothetical protein